jgi:hypothetical protein
LVEAAPDQQLSLSDPDARSMATSGKGTGVVGYNVQTAVDAKHHLIVAHEVTNVGNDRAQLAKMAGEAKAAMGGESLEVLADRGYFSGQELLACGPLGVTPLVPKPLTSGAKARGRFGKQDFVYVPGEDVYRCPAGQALTHRFTTLEDGMNIHIYWTSDCAGCPLKSQCTSGKERRIRRWEHEDVIDAMQARLDATPNAHAHPPRYRRAPLRHAQGLDGHHPLQDQDPQERPNRDEPPSARLQSETGDRDPRRKASHGRHPSLSGHSQPTRTVTAKPRRLKHRPYLRSPDHVLTQAGPKAAVGYFRNPLL